jgi:alkylation response protein AidB-like acyl-CoA dehydrogenase
VDFEFSDVQRAWREKAQQLGGALAEDAAAGDVVTGAARVGLIDAKADVLAAALAVEVLACSSAAAGMTLALHTSVVLALEDDGFVAGSARLQTIVDSLARGEVVGALALSSEDVPSIEGGRLDGRASWVGPITDHGVALIGARDGANVSVFVVPLDAAGVRIVPLRTTALSGFAWANLTLTGTPRIDAGEPTRVMARARTLIAAVALGIGGRALRESLAVVQREHGAGGEQTVQGLLADTATELEAARMLTWDAAAQGGEVSLGDASMAKLAATGAAQAAVVRATQVVGVDSFRRGHVIERLTQDVRAIELFAGRTEALREAVAAKALPGS